MTEITASRWSSGSAGGSVCRGVCVILRQLAVFTAAVGVVLAANPPINVIVSSEAAPPGATVQIKLYLAQPKAVDVGEIALTLDPKVFGPVTAIATFSGTGDACGYAFIKGNSVDIHFASVSATAGDVAGLPLVVITVPTLATAAPGTKTIVTADPSGSKWKDIAGIVYPVTVTPGTVTLGGTLSVRMVSPGAGLLPAQSVVHVAGSGFTASTTVDVAGVSVASVALVGPQQIDLTLGAPADMGGKRVTVSDPGGARVDFFAAPPAAPLGTSQIGDFDGALPLFPMVSYKAGITGFLPDPGGFWIALQNPNSTPVNAVLQLNGLPFFGVKEVIPITIPAGGSFSKAPSYTEVSRDDIFRVFASAPLRMLYLEHPDQAFVYLADKLVPLMPTTASPLTVLFEPSHIEWTWQTGTTSPQPQTVAVGQSQFPLTQLGANFTVSVATSAGGNWLSVTPSSASFTCASSAPGTTPVCSSATISVSADPVSLAPGIYRGTITATPVSSEQPVVPSTIDVALTVTSFPIFHMIVDTATSLYTEPGAIPVLSKTFAVTPDMLGTPFTLSARTSSGVNWLSATSAGAPAQVTVSADPGNLLPGTYAGVVTAQGPRGILVIETTLAVFGGGSQLQSYGTPVFSAAPNGAPPPAQTVNVFAQCQFDCPPDGAPADLTLITGVSTISGGNWLHATPSTGGNVVINADPSEIFVPGIYTGVVSVSSVATTPTEIAVALVVRSGPASALAATPSSISVTGQFNGVSPLGQICVTTGFTVVPVSATALTSNGGNWLSVSVDGTPTPTCGINASLDASHLAPGTYRGTITLSVSGQSLNVPVVVNFTSDSPSFDPDAGPPALGSVLSAASAIAGAIAPGEIITIHGLEIGPSSPLGMTLDGQGKVATNLNGVQVLINGNAAPLIYASASQINAIVPYEVAGQNTATVQLLYDGGSGTWGVPVVPAAPAIFTVDETGAGPAAVLNQDNSINSPAMPAARDSVIQIFATGIPVAGAITGTITPALNPNGAPPLSVSIGGVNAPVIYAGPAPGAPAGLFLLKVTVPPAAVTGVAVSLTLSVGAVQSQAGVTISVK